MQPDEMKALRKSIGWTQDELAEAIGMSRVQIGLMERGVATIERRTELAVRYVTDQAKMFAQGVTVNP
ncbi:helix-turn-helix domain-containing protein [Sphingobium yanoikuyae]|uniref:helix-turn-helix domain-containing protein n=1 Tax=Sphingobium yanoikuyae TaxID=13690 RepID=UPI00242CCBFE|nr:helix-turn-helix transcriptional regulator [Sphingobium yanoikuyae]